VWRNEAGEVIGTFGTSQDITRLKEAEAQVERAHQQLVETSRLAGMAEVATSVLHNVGNVLNSVNVSSTLVLDLVRKSRLNHLGRLAALIREQSGNLAAFFAADPRGQQLPDYLSQLVQHLTDEQAQVAAEVELTRKNIEHIKDIVTMQQNYAKFSGVVETVSVTALVDDAVQMNAGALARHQVELARDYPAAAVECQTERQKVLQILINLIRNAKYACDESGHPDKRLTLRVRAGDSRVQITVLDNGVGIPPENLTRIFNHGFTTRATGHGFGLHSGAIAAKELGGSLSAFSDGPGTGARFVLELPLKPRAKP
jgi:C4-dicarboxylate-specific signal transduction histidine kinase